MKRLCVFCILFILFKACTYDYDDRPAWDSGRQSQEVFEERSQEGVIDSTRSNIPPISKPHTEVPQPY